MKLLTTLLLLGLPVASAVAQADPRPISISLPTATGAMNLRSGDVLGNKLQGKLDHTYGSEWGNLEGQPWIQRSWQPGEVIINKQRVNGVMVRYDAFGQQLLAVSKGKTDTLVLDHNTVQGFIMQDEASAGHLRTFQRFDNAPQPTQRLNFVEVLHAGQYRLLKHHGRQLNKANDGVMLNGDSHNDRISEVYTYYLSRPDGVAVPVRLNAKALSAAAPELAAAIKNALASKKADNNETGMAALLDSIDKPQ